jgi:hypothetical protein
MRLFICASFLSLATVPPYHSPELRAHCSRYRDKKASSRARTQAQDYTAFLLPLPSPQETSWWTEWWTFIEGNCESDILVLGMLVRLVGCRLVGIVARTGQCTWFTGNLALYWAVKGLNQEQALVGPGHHSQ